MAYENLIVTERESIKVITINRPSVLNALNKKTLCELEQAIWDVGTKTQIRSIIITGSGDKSFVAGADIAEMKDLDALGAEQFSSLGHRVFDLIASIKVPVIAAVNGFALGGGLELALACDFIYASQNAIFGLVETKLGLIPGFGGVARLTRRLGSALAKEMIFAAAQIDALRAYELGLINKMSKTGDVLEDALDMAKKIALRGPYAVSTSKKLIQEGENSDLRTANALEKIAFGLVFSSLEREEGIKAFLEKRNPSF